MGMIYEHVCTYYIPPSIRSYFSLKFLNCKSHHFSGNILQSSYNYDDSANQNYDENNHISQNAELPDGWRGDKSGDSEDYEWQWIGI